MSIVKSKGRLGRGGGVSGGRGIGGIDGTVVCRCPKCGQTEPHGRGVPCTSVRCPRCGARMRGERCASDAASRAEPI
jgi:hypothetical protein